MTIIYRDEGGLVSEELEYDNYEFNRIDFCDGFAYFTSAAENADGNKIERTIPVSSIVEIIY